MDLCEKLDMPQRDVEKLVSKRGEHVTGDFILRVEREINIDGRKAPYISLWKAGICCYKGAINPYLFESLDTKT